VKKFEPTKSEKIVISIRIEDAKLKHIDNIANGIDISRNELINQCLDYALENVKFRKQ